jgi:hypothetical protein
MRVVIVVAGGRSTRLAQMTPMLDPRTNRHGDLGDPRVFVPREERRKH